MAVELATAYVSISASAGGIGRSIKSELGAGEAAVGSSSARMSSALTGAFKGVAGAVVGIGATVAGLALGGGINRALAIDNAQSKMKSLGYSTDQIASVMQSSLDSVKGTMFGLGDAASLASQLIAAGVRPGQDLSRALGLTADMAAVANVSLGDLTPVMGQLASSGRLYTQDLLQLQDRGLPVFAWLAESLGTTVDNVRNMVAAGDVSFTQLETAIQQHVGGAAKHTDSFKASLENVKAALSRFGAAIATPAMGMLKGIFLAAIPAVDALTAKMQPIVDSLTLRLGPVVDSLSAKMKTVFDGNAFAGLAGLGPILAPIAGMVAAIGGSSIAGALPLIGNLLPTISGPMGAIVGFMGAMLANSPGLRAALGNAFSAIGQVVQALAPVFATLAPLIGSLAETVGNLLADAINTVLPIVVQLAQMLGPVLAQIVQMLTPIIAELMGALGDSIPIFGQILAELMPVIQEALPPLMSLLGMLISAILPVLIMFLKGQTAALAEFAKVIGWVSDALVIVIGWIQQAISWLGAGGLGGAMQSTGSSITSVWTAVWTGIVTTVQGALGFLGQVIANMLAPIQAVWQVFWSTFGGLITAVWNFIVTAVQLAVALVQLVVTYAWLAISAVTTAAWNAISAVISSVWASIVGAVSAAIGAVWNAISPTLSMIWATWSATWNAVRDALGSVWNSITSTVSTAIGMVVSTVSGLQGQLVGFFTGAGSWLYESGKAIVQGLIDGITRMISGATGAMSDLLRQVQNLLPHSPALEGPFSGKGWTLYSGQAISKALGEGMLDAQSVPVAAARKLAAATQGALSISANPVIGASPNRALESAGVGGNVHNWVLNTNDPVEMFNSFKRRENAMAAV